MKLEFILFTALLFSTSAYSGGWVTQDGVITLAKVENGVALFVIEASDLAYPDGCDNTGGAVVLQDDTKNGDRQYALLLAAYTAGNSVRIYSSGCYTGWGSNYPKVYAAFSSK